MPTNNKNYYDVLGISPNADLKEIKTRYKELMKENHPDRFKGLKAKYEADGDDDLLKILAEKISQAEDTCKLINEAFSILSDKGKRKAYDEKIYEPDIQDPKIDISVETISFGIMKVGQGRSKSFMIKNNGGPVSAVDINWDIEPDWGEIIIEPDPNEVFPIKVTINALPKSVSTSSDKRKINIIIDGTLYVVNIDVAFQAIKTAPTPSTKPHTTKARKTTTGTSSRPTRRITFGWIITLISFLILGFLFFEDELAGIGISVSTPTPYPTPTPVVLLTIKPKMEKCVDMWQDLAGSRERVEEKVGDMYCLKFTVVNMQNSSISFWLPENSPVNGDHWAMPVWGGIQKLWNMCNNYSTLEARQSETYICTVDEGRSPKVFCLEVRVGAGKTETVCTGIDS